MSGSCRVCTTPGRESVREIIRKLHEIKDDAHARVLQRFFKTGPGEYGEGDVFLGIRVPQLRSLARTYAHLDPGDALELLRSPFHEARLLALIILVQTYRSGDAFFKGRIYNLYLENTRFINNWDLVDVSAEHILGAYLFEGDRAPLVGLARSEDLWERRMAVMATFHFIRKGEFAETFAIAAMLLSDREDLIHKACGWMLREIGKRDPEAEEGFLARHCRIMPRTMLRYAIERFPRDRRQYYLKGMPDRD